MKKILAFALSAVMALALLAGCGNQTDNKIGRASCRERV